MSWQKRQGTSTMLIKNALLYPRVNTLAQNDGTSMQVFVKTSLLRLLIKTCTYLVLSGSGFGRRGNCPATNIE